MKRLIPMTLIVTIMFVLLFVGPVMAQDSSPAVAIPDLTLMTEYPSQEAGAGETITVKLSLVGGANPQIANLALDNLPEGWQATFRGQNKIVQSVFVDPQNEATVDLRIDIPNSAKTDTYKFDVVARSDNETARLPLALMVEEKGPAQLNLDIDLPTLREKPNGTFKFNGNLTNDGESDLTVDLTADAPSGFAAVFKSGSQEVTSLPIEAGKSERITLEVDPLYDDLTPAGQYPVQIMAKGGDLQAEAGLVAEVVGESRLTLTTPDNRLSGDIQAGESNSLSLVLVNSGSAPAQKVAMSATQPNGWTVQFDPETVPEVGPGEQVEVTASIQPNEKALAGDYMLTFRAKPEDSASKSIDYRATVRTSTLWGLVGVILIVVAVVALTLAVARFGRR